jgi:lipopolysaccharide/colanic/teichoic acid biosynthesis glycosyltransferase
VSSVASSYARAATSQQREVGVWLEKAIAVALLIILSPLLIAVAFVVRVLSGGSPLVAHLRVGRYGAPVWIYKFRTMWQSSSTGWIEHVVEEPMDLKRETDPRITHAFARLLRRHSIDELPQLWNIATGELAFIGPRPMTRSELETHYASAISAVLAVRPGLTGLWQVSGRSRLSYAERRNLDLSLIQGLSIKRYIWILSQTVVQVIKGSDAW